MAETETKLEEKKALIPVGNAGLQLTTLTDMWRFAGYIVTSGWAPKGMEKPESVLVAIEFGYEVGLRPMQALQSVAVINGRPSMYGDAALGLVLASGWSDGVPYEHFEGDGDSLTAICECKRRGSLHVVKQTFSVSDAKKAQLWGKAGPWTQYPKRMLQMRARGFALRDAFPDVLKGLSLAEETRDLPPPIELEAGADGTYGANPSTLNGLTEKLKENGNPPEGESKGRGGRPKGSRNRPKADTPPVVPDAETPKPAEAPFDGADGVNDDPPVDSETGEINTPIATAAETILQQEYNGEFPADLTAARALIITLAMIEGMSRPRIMKLYNSPISGLTHEQCNQIFADAIDGKFDNGQ